MMESNISDYEVVLRLFYKKENSNVIHCKEFEVPCDALLLGHHITFFAKKAKFRIPIPGPFTPIKLQGAGRVKGLNFNWENFYLGSARKLVGEGQYMLIHWDDTLQILTKHIYTS